MSLNTRNTFTISMSIVLALLSLCTVWVYGIDRISHENERVHVECLSVSSREFVDGNCIIVRP